MRMKGLNQFVSFDWEAFAQGKQFVVTKVSDYADFDSKAHLGTKVECVIAVDKTPYTFKDGVSFSNRFEKVTFKVGKDISIPLESRVIPKGVTATVYGDYRNLLSIKCDDIVVAVPKERN